VVHPSLVVLYGTRVGHLYSSGTRSSLAVPGVYGLLLWWERRSLSVVHYRRYSRNATNRKGTYCIIGSTVVIHSCCYSSRYSTTITMSHLKTIIYVSFLPLPTTFLPSFSFRRIRRLGRLPTHGTVALRSWKIFQSHSSGPQLFS
jgi:hypothetical protein